MKCPENQPLTPRQLQVIPHILSATSYEEAARRADISPKQIYRWLENPLFKQELAKKRNEAYQNALSYLKSISISATETLSALLSNADPRIRLSAADKILSHALRGLETFEFEERLSAIENRVITDHREI